VLLLLLPGVPRPAWAVTLVSVAQVNGTIWDVHLHRILFLDESGAYPKLKIRYRDTRREVIIPRTSQPPNYGFLTLTGAVFVAGGVLEAGVYEWANRRLSFLGFPNSTYSLEVSSGSGRYAIWNGGDQPGYADGQTLYLRDLQTGTNTVVGTGTVN
jgi:hypothetical protein